MNAAMLADSISRNDLPAYVEDDNWWIELKVDGHRVMMEVFDSVAIPYNRNGRVFRQSISKQVVSEFRHPAFKGRWVFDGELVNADTYHVFDLLDVPSDKIDLANAPYRERRQVLEEVMTRWAPFHTIILPTCRTTLGKQSIVERALNEGCEGVMVKNQHGLYAPGKRSDMMLKAKFVNEADVVIAVKYREGKRSIGVEAYDENGKAIDIGAITMTDKNLGRVNVGDVITARYLYLGNGGKLFQPAFVRVRTDKEPQECTMDQFKQVNKNVPVGMSDD